MARILMTTFGSYGDVHPFMAIGMELRDRGHHVTIATSAAYEPKIRSEGLDFTPVRPDVSFDDTAFVERMMDTRRGSERVIRYLASTAREAYEDVLPAVQRSDLVVTHAVSYGPVLAVEKTGVPWVSVVVTPILFFSVYDPPVQAPAPWLDHLRVFGPRPFEWLKSLAKLQTKAWIRPLLDLRKEIGLPPGAHPLFEGQHSPRLVLGLFAKCFAAIQPDWPPQTFVTGFPFFDKHHEHQGLSPELERFLADGPPPLVFSLGTSAVGAAGDFYTESLQAAEAVGMRALFLTGRGPQGLPPTAMSAPYAPHSELFPRAAAVIHHGGVGTTAQAMRSGRPMLVVPFSHDQFDNGARIQRLGIGEVLYRSRYHARSAARLLRRLVEEPRYAQAGSIVAAQVRAEEGASKAASAILGINSAAL